MSAPEQADFIIIGAGIAGASVAYFLAPQCRVLLLERESQPGYHSTGRSAAQYIASYGPPQVQALTRASLDFFERPPAGFAAAPLLTRRGALTVAAPGQEELLDEAWALLESLSENGQRLDAAATLRLLPVLRREAVLGSVFEPDSYDIDVHALHQGFLKGLRAAGGSLVCDAAVEALNHAEGAWWVRAGGRVFSAPVLINAAGAWCDEIARLAGVRPLGLQPKRRSAFNFRPPEGVDCTHWPLVIAADQGWYFKPDAGQLLGSPVNEDPVPPQDVRPEELDIALGAYNIEQATVMSVRPQHPWAGLRSFVADGELVGGFDAQAPGFFWLAGQGGYGIQTAPAMGQACAALARGQVLPETLQHWGVSEARLSPRRLAD